jgi:hypothetical protein
MTMWRENDDINTGDIQSMCELWFDGYWNALTIELNTHSQITWMDSYLVFNWTFTLKLHGWIHVWYSIEHSLSNYVNGFLLSIQLNIHTQTAWMDLCLVFNWTHSLKLREWIHTWYLFEALIPIPNPIWDELILPDNFYTIILPPRASVARSIPR